MLCRFCVDPANTDADSWLRALYLACSLDLFPEYDNGLLVLAKVSSRLERTDVLIVSTLCRILVIGCLRRSRKTLICPTRG
jgi:hypothetical protein